MNMSISQCAGFCSAAILKGLLYCILAIPVLPGFATAAVLEEIVVVAQKREQNLQDVGISISAFSSNAIESLGWSDSVDVAAQVPGLTTSKETGSHTSHFNIRGVGQADFAAHHEAPNAVYLDDVYVASPIAVDMPMFDLERIEVLRGPQGTLFGRNATGGVVHYLSNKPSREQDASISLEAGEYNLIRAEGVIGGPLSEIASGRLALYSTSADGYVENEIGSDLREQGQVAARGQILLEPGDSTEVLLKLDGSKKDIDTGIWQTIPSFTGADGWNQFIPPDLNVYGVPGGDFYGWRDDDGDPHTVQADTVGFIEKDTYGVTADVTHAFPNVTLTSITNVNSVESKFRHDCDSSPFAQCLVNRDDDVNQFSQELRLDGETAKFKWITGLYYLDIDGDYFDSVGLPTLAGFFAPGLFPGDGSGTGEGTGATTQTAWSVDTTSWAVFAQGEWSLSSQLALTLGIRWTDDEKDLEADYNCVSEAPGTCTFLGFENVGDIIVDGVNFGPAVADLGTTSLDRSDGDWSGKVQLDYRATENLLLYAGAHKGFKAGGFAVPVDGLSPPELLPYEPEELFSYEIGGKYEFGVGRLNVSAFIYDYQDFQSFEFRGLTTLILNKDAKYVGGEVDLELRPMDGLDLRFGASYLDAEVEDIPTPGGVQDQEPINAPEWQVNWLARKSFPVGDGWMLSFQYDGSWTDERYFNIVNAPTVFAPSYALHNARVTLEDVAGKWSVSLAGRNLGDEEPIDSAFDVTALGWTMQKIGPPRWISGSVTYRFW